VVHEVASLPPADVVAQVRADPPHLVQALERHGFVAELTTVQMAMELNRRTCPGLPVVPVQL
jgi:predicted ArsR family transcriptional regulator